MLGGAGSSGKLEVGQFWALQMQKGLKDLTYVQVNF